MTDPKTNDETRLEMFDWYHAMAATRVELIAYFQNQMRRRGVLRRPDRRRIQPGHRRGDRELSRRARPEPRGGAQRGVLLRLPGRRPHQDQATGAAGTLRRAGTAVRRSAPGPRRGTGSRSTRAPAAAPLKLSLTTPKQQTRFARGESINLALAPSQDAHVYCYLQDEDAKVIRFFPNRFARDSRIAAAKPLDAARRDALPAHDEHEGRARDHLLLRNAARRDGFAAAGLGRHRLRTPARRHART